MEKLVHSHTCSPYLYSSPSIAGPKTPKEYADSEMVIARTSSSSSLISTSESYGSLYTCRRLQWQLQQQQAPVAYQQPFLEDFGPVTYEGCMKTVQEMPASSYQETNRMPSTKSSYNGNWVAPVEASHSTPTTHSTHKVVC